MKSIVILYSISFIIVSCGNNSEIKVDVTDSNSISSLSYQVTKPSSLTLLTDEDSDLDLSFEALAIGEEVSIYSDSCLTQITSFIPTSTTRS